MDLQGVLLHRRLTLAVAMLAGSGALGCASTPQSAEPDRAYPLSVVDRAPVLIACAPFPGPAPSQISGVERERVRVRFVVTEAGMVDPDWVVVTGGGVKRTRSVSSAARDEATARALTCRYEPAMLGDEPVRVVTEHTFSIQVMS